MKSIFANFFLSMLTSQVCAQGRHDALRYRRLAGEKHAVNQDDQNFWERFLQNSDLSTPCPTELEPIVASPTEEPNVFAPVPVTPPLTPPEAPHVPAVPTLVPVVPVPPRDDTSNSSFVPICKQDPFGKFVQFNNPIYDIPGTKIVRSEVTNFESSDKALSIAKEVSNGIQSTLPTLAAIETQKITTLFKNAFNSIALAAGALSLGLNLIGPLFGIGGDSTEDAILKQVTDGFRVVNDRLTDIQLQIRKAQLEISAFISDVVLDELTSDLDSMMREFSNYVTATNEARPYYDAIFRSYCNEPFHTPRDIFFSLYGYACSNCTFASRKRADIKKIVAELNPTSQSAFRNNFGNIILQSMYNAMFLHSVCLPPIEGSCIDRSVDAVWLKGVDDMKNASIEATSVIDTVASTLSDWVNLIRVEQLNQFFPDGVDNIRAAEDVFNVLSSDQPDFHIQILVSDAGSDFFRANIWRSGCDKTTDPSSCSTIRTETGHFFLQVKSKNLSVRYRLKTLPDSGTTISINGNIRPFPDFFDEVANRLNVETSVELKRPDDNYCPLDIIKEATAESGQIFPDILRVFPACLIDICVSCDDTEKAAFQTVLGLEQYYIFRTGFNNVQEFTSNTAIFPRFNAIVGETFLLNSGTNEFIFYYS